MCVVSFYQTPRNRNSTILAQRPRTTVGSRRSSTFPVGKVDLTLDFRGLKIPQTFTVIKNLNYKMILGLDFMHGTQAYVNFSDNTLSICDDLIIEHMLPHKQPVNAIRPTSTTVIAPSSEAVIPVTSIQSHDGQYLATPLPYLSKKRIGMAHAVVSLNHGHTHCRVLNPTDNPVTLTKRTALATLTPISNTNIYNYEKSQTSHSTPTVDIETQLKIITDKGLHIDAAEYTKEEREKLISLLYNNRDLFTSELSELPGTDLVEHHIDVGNASPIRQRPYRQTADAKKEVDKQIKRLLDSNIIEESDSPWSSPIVLIKKKNNTYRLCVYMRRVNAVTKPVFYPLPLLEDVFQTVAENNPTTYSCLDMTSGYYQLSMAKSSRPVTGFSTHSGHYQFRRMPFGVTGAPATYQALMAKVLRNILFSYALCYVDDILCMSPTPEKHCEHLNEIFDRFRQAKLRLNPAKCKFALSRVIYLGHVLSKEGIAVDESKVEVIKSFPTPRNTQQVRSILGISNYYRRFLKDYSMKTANLRSLLKRDAKFVWNSAHQAEFDFIKQALTSAPILAFPNMQKPFILTTDACCSGLSFILSQLDNKGQEHVIAFGGRGLRKSEINCTVSELECLAIIEGTRHYHTYLVGRPFTIITDHVSLKYLNSLKLGTGRLQRWALHLQGYSYTVQYKPGKKLTNADGLSRRDYPPPPSVSDNDVVDDDNILSAVDIDPSGNAAACTHQTAHNKCMHSINFIYDVASNSNTTTDNIDTSEVMNISALVDSTNIAAEQHQCSDFRHIFAYLETGELPDDNTVARRTVFESEQYTIISGTLYHLYAPRQKGKDKINSVVQQLCIPSTLRDDITKAYHDNNGHIGFDKLYESIRNKYYWPRMYAELSEYVKNCSECQQAKRPVHKKKAPLKPLPVEDVFARFHLDYLGPLPPSNGYRYLLVAIDSTSLYPEIHPTKTCDADETAKVLYEQVFCRYGCPLSILTDRGSCFRSALVNALCKIFKVKQIFTSSFHPQTNSRAENMNSIILKSLRIYCKNQTEWSTLIPAICWSYRASTTTSHGFSPFEVLFGKPMRTPIDTAILNDVRTSPSVDAYLQQMIPKIELTREIAKQNIQDCNKSTQFYYDRQTAYPGYAIGQRVLIFDPTNKKGICKKLKKRWLGPYFITDKSDNHTYKLRRCNDGQELRSHIHANRLRPYHEPTSTPTTQTQATQPTDTSSSTPSAPLDDGWFEIHRVTNRKVIAGKPHFLVHWKDGTKSYEPEDNITELAKNEYYTRCQNQRRSRRRVR